MSEVAICVMATRRDDAKAQANWVRLMQDVDARSDMSGLILDRTPTGSVADTLAQAGWVPIDSRVSVHRQSYESPVRDIWAALTTLDAEWVIGLADDDTWADLTSVTLPEDTSVVSVVPRLFMALSGASGRVADDPLLPQHVIYGFLRSHVVREVARYLKDAPAPWGGEDDLILFVAQQMGNVVVDEHFSYTYSPGNWTPETADETRAILLTDVGWGELTDWSSAVLFQSLDRLAICAYLAEVVEPVQWSQIVDESLARFWPVTHKEHRRTWVRLPGSLRQGLLASRGKSGSKRFTGTLSSTLAAVLRRTARASTWERLQSGRHVVRSERDVRDLVIPALQSVAPPAAHEQIRHWEDCVRRVCELRASQGGNRVRRPAALSGP